MTVRLLSVLLAVMTGMAQAQQQFSPAVRPFINVDSPVVALVHARVIDGTGAPAVEEQTVVLAHGLIRGVGSAIAVPPEAKVIDAKGLTIIPGLIGMHDHLFYPVGADLYGEMGYSFPRLYLAAGVTSIRTTGSMEPYTDLQLKKLIDAGKIPGPRMHITGPYMEGKGAFIPQMYELSGPEDARRTVDYWASEGVTSFKAYMHMTRDELKATISAAHAHGLMVTGHLCSIGFREAAEMGIDNLEHGLLEDSEFVPSKKADDCPAFEVRSEVLKKLDLKSPDVREVIRDLIAHHVAITSTLALYESYVPSRPPLETLARSLDLMAPGPREDYIKFRKGLEVTPNISAERLKEEMAFEHEFVKAGGLLLAGLDPNGGGGLLAGFGDQREVELLVEAGFTPIEAIHIATANGAAFLGEGERKGSISAGKVADLVLIEGNPGENIADIEKVRMVFKDGVGYDPAKLIESVRGVVGIH